MKYPEKFVIFLALLLVLGFSPRPTVKSDSSNIISNSSESATKSNKAKSLVGCLGCSIGEGSEDAAVVMVEFSALTCHHCAEFQKKIYPFIKEKYIDTGKIRFITSYLPLDFLSLEETVCLNFVKDVKKREQFRDAIFESQKPFIEKVEVVLAKYPKKDATEEQKTQRLGELTDLTSTYIMDLARLTNLDQEEIVKIKDYLAIKEKKDAYNKEFINLITKVYKEVKIDGTPTMVINNKVLSGTRDIEFWDKEIQLALQEAQAHPTTLKVSSAG